MSTAEDKLEANNAAPATDLDVISECVIVASPAGTIDAISSAAPAPEPLAAQSQGRRGEVQLTDQTNLLPFHRLLPIFLALSLCVLVDTVDSVVVATALPTIASHFHSSSYISWIPSAYLLTSTAFQPLYGRFSDIFGRKATLAIGMAIYMIGSLAAGFSNSMIQLIVCRGIAGAGGGGILSIVQIILSDLVTLRERGKYVGYVAGITAAGFAIGPVVGGALAQKVSWRWCFWITLPLALTSTLVVMFILPLKPVQGDIRGKLLIVDYIGTLLTLAGCTLLTLPLIWGGVTFPWSSGVVIGPLCAGVVLVAIFCSWEWKGARLPIVPMYIFKHVTVTGVYIGMFINGFVFYSLLFYLPQLYQVALGFSPTRSGVFLLPVLVTMVFASMASGISVSRTGRYRIIVYVGFSLSAIGCGLLSIITKSSPRGLLVFFMIIVGLGYGMTLQTTTVAAQASVSRRDMSVVTAVRNFLRLFGGTLALAVDSTIINNSLRNAASRLSLPASVSTAIIDAPALLATPSALSLTPSQATFILTHGYMKGFHSLFVLNAALTALAVVTSVLMIRHKELVRPDEAKLKEEARRALEEKRGTTDGKESRVMQTEGDVEMGQLTGEGDN